MVLRIIKQYLVKRGKLGEVGIEGSRMVTRWKRVKVDSIHEPN